jgi:PAS domain-containing protein
MKLSDQFLKNAASIRRRAMESQFERLDSVCEGAVATDRAGRVVWINDKYLPILGLRSAEETLGREIEEVIPNSLMRRLFTRVSRSWSTSSSSAASRWWSRACRCRTRTAL